MWDVHDSIKILNIIICIAGIVKAIKTKDIAYVPIIIWLIMSVVYYASTFVVHWSGEWANPVGAGLLAWGYTMVFFMIRRRNG